MQNNTSINTAIRSIHHHTSSKDALIDSLIARFTKTDSGRIDVRSLANLLKDMDADTKTLKQFSQAIKNQSSSPVDATWFEELTELSKSEQTWDPAALFKEQFGDLAQDKNRFHTLLKTVYGGAYTTEKAEEIRQKVLANDFTFLPKIRFLDDSTLQGAQGAWDSENQTIYLNQSLRDNPELLQKTFVEEAGHFLDSVMSRIDAQGDEGELFRRMMSGESLSASELSAIRVENDAGKIEVDGQLVDVEFWSFSKTVKKVKRAFKKVGKDIEDGLRKAGDEIERAGKKIEKEIKRAGRDFDDEIHRLGRKIDDELHNLGDEIQDAWDGVKDYIAEHEWAQSVLTAVATFYGGPLGAALAGAFIGYTKGLEGKDLLKAAVINGALAYVGGGSTASTLGGVLKQEATSALINQATKNIDNDIVRTFVQGAVGGLASSSKANLKEAFKAAKGDLADTTKEFFKIDKNKLRAMSKEAIKSGKDELIDMAKAEAVEWTVEKLDNVAISSLVHAWVASGGNYEDFSQQLIEHGKQAAINEIAKGIDNEALRELATQTAEQALSGDMPAGKIVETAGEQLAQTIKQEAVKWVEKEIDNPNLARMATTWVNANGDIELLRDLLPEAAEVVAKDAIKKEIDRIDNPQLKQLANTWFNDGLQAAADQIPDMARKAITESLESKGGSDAQQIMEKLVKEVLTNGTTHYTGADLRMLLEDAINHTFVQQANAGTPSQTTYP